jgi:hypothetical protein
MTTLQKTTIAVENDPSIDYLPMKMVVSIAILVDRRAPLTWLFSNRGPSPQFLARPSCIFREECVLFRLQWLVHRDLPVRECKNPP